MMGLAKVKFSKEVFEALFTEGSVFGVNKGVPKGAKLIKIQYMDGAHEGIFEHDSFEQSSTIPEIEVEFSAYSKDAKP